MNKCILEFVVPHLYSNEEIYTSLGVGNTGGIRIKKKRNGSVARIVIFTSIPTQRQLSENPYQDRLEGDILTYTGTGRAGSQKLSGINSRIPEQVETKVPVYVFTQVAHRRDKKIGARRWGFLGLVEYIRSYQENQVDGTGKVRSVWLFEFRLCTSCHKVSVDADREIMSELISKQTKADREDREISSNSIATVKQTNDDIARAESVRSRLLALDPKAFEHVIADILVCSGFDDVTVTRYSQDGGIDINAKLGWRAWPLRNLLTQIQAKRWRHTVGRKEVAELRGSMQPHASGCIVTTSRFSRAAITEASEQGKVPITTINGEELSRLVCQLNPPFCHDWF